MVHVSFKQAKSEVACATDNPSSGYNRAFAEIIRGGVSLATGRNVSPDIIALGQSVVDALEVGEAGPR